MAWGKSWTSFVMSKVSQNISSIVYWFHLISSHHHATPKKQMYIIAINFQIRIYISVWYEQTKIKSNVKLNSVPQWKHTHTPHAPNQYLKFVKHFLQMWACHPARSLKRYSLFYGLRNPFTSSLSSMFLVSRPIML